MPFDTMTMAAVTDQLRDTLLESRVQRILQPSEHAIALAAYAGGTERWLVLSADPRAARIYLASERLAKAFATPSPFVMLLRKHLDGRRVTDIRQTEGERILSIHCSSRDEDMVLVAEIMGKHSNVILTADDRVLGALKIVPPSKSRARPIIPSRPYAPPPAQSRDERLFPPGPRLDPYREPRSFIDLLQPLLGSTSAAAALAGLLIGASPFLVEQILAHAGSEPTALMSEVLPAAVCESASRYYSLYTTRAWRPHTFVRKAGACDFAPYQPTGVTGVSASPSISDAIESCSLGVESRDPLSSLRSTILSDVAGERRAVERRIASLSEELRSAAGAETLMEEGQLILAYQHLITPNARELAIPDLGVTIRLDPDRSAADNAAHAFKRYHKLREAARRLPALLAKAERELERIADLAAFVAIATTEAELRSIAGQIRPEARPVRPGKRRERPAGPARYTFGGVTALVGRNAQENEEVTFRRAGRDDLWLHAHERTGTHLILQGAALGVADEVIVAAAQLAAYFSDGRQDTRVEVDVARPRDVRKIPGAAPGRVTYRSIRTIAVRPSLAGWTRQG